MNSSSSCILSQSEQEKLIHKLEIFKIQGRDKSGRPLLHITGKVFPARLVGPEAVKQYLKQNVFPKLNGRPFSVMYLHTGVQFCQNFPGISALRSIHDAIPTILEDNLHTVYFLHPGIQSRLLIATLGRLLVSQRFYSKIKYVHRLEFLWNHARRNEIDLPEFVYEHDEAFDHECTLVEYALESDYRRKIDHSPAADRTPVGMYSMRCIA